MIYEELFKKPEPKPETQAQSNAEQPPAADAHALLLRLLKEPEPAHRRALLEQGRQAWPEDRLLPLLGSFFDLRYKPARTKAGFADLLLALLVEGMTLTNIARPPRSNKQLTQLFKKNRLLDWVAEADAQAERRDLFFGECMQMLDFFATSCRQDKQYASGFMGLVKASPERIENKIHSDLGLLLEYLLEAEKAENCRAQWTAERLIFRNALELFVQNL